MIETMETVNVKIPPTMREQMTTLAKANERTLAAEIRIAIREHLLTSNKGENNAE